MNSATDGVAGHTGQVQGRIKVGAIDAAALGPLLKIGPPSKN